MQGTGHRLHAKKTGEEPLVKPSKRSSFVDAHSGPEKGEGGRKSPVTPISTSLFISPLSSAFAKKITMLKLIRVDRQIGKEVGTRFYRKVRSHFGRERLEG